MASFLLATTGILQLRHAIAKKKMILEVGSYDGTSHLVLLVKWFMVCCVFVHVLLLCFLCPLTKLDIHIFRGLHLSCWFLCLNWVLNWGKPNRLSILCS